jgi:hypothetical protein
VGEDKFSTTFLHIPTPNERCGRRRILEAAHTNNGDVINDDVIPSLEDGRDLMKKMLRKLCEKGKWRGSDVFCFALNNVSSPQNAGAAITFVIVAGRVLRCGSVRDLPSYRTAVQQRLPKAAVIAVSYMPNSGSAVTDFQMREDLLQKKTPWPLVRKRTISTERPPLVDEI